ncbi:hypothetical protein KEJ33_04290 [Candidatus Bathyarchaeota archaeon]|nr:hypothetical protein [Candidatus Bathyarchaeota archaeon]
MEKQAEKNPVKIEGSTSNTGFKITWDNVRNEPKRGSSSDILDSLYLGKNMDETVIVERKVAGLLRDRLRGLEDENLKLKKRLTTLKILLIALGIGLLFVTILLLSMIIPQFRIIL